MNFKLLKVTTSLTLLVAMTACASLDEDLYRSNSVSENFNITSQATISSNRNLATFYITNTGIRDLYCSGLNLRAVSDNPNTYLEAGEMQTLFGGIFVRAGKTLQWNSSAAESSSRPANWRSAEIDLDIDQCQQADFLSFCKFADRTVEEDGLMLWLHTRFNASNCEALNRKLSSVRSLHLPEDQPKALRPLIFLRELRSVSLVNTDANSRWVDEFLLSSSSSFVGVSLR